MKYSIDLELSQASRIMLDELEGRIDELVDKLMLVNDLLEKLIGDRNGSKREVQGDNQ